MLKRPKRALQGMSPALVGVHLAPLATRNLADFREMGVALLGPWRG